MDALGVKAALSGVRPVALLQQQRAQQAQQAANPGPAAAAPPPPPRRPSPLPPPPLPFSRIGVPQRHTLPQHSVLTPCSLQPTSSSGSSSSQQQQQQLHQQWQPASIPEQLPQSEAGQRACAELAGFSARMQAPFTPPS